jgi:hypothetical protein
MIHVAQLLGAMLGRKLLALYFVLIVAKVITS